MNATYALKSRMASGGMVYGAIVGPGNRPLPVTELLKTAGYDFLIIDREHSLVNPETILDYVRAGKELEVPILVRPEENWAPWRCLLDSGVSGLMLPMVDSVEEAVQAIDRAFFPPVGHRGYGLGMSPYPLDGIDPGHVPHHELTGYINNNTVLLPQTESRKAVSNLSRVLALEGVAGTVVGTFDLALDIGGIPEGASRLDLTRSKDIEGSLAEVARICGEHGKIAGAGGLTPEDMARWAEQGYRMYVIGTVTDGDADAVCSTLWATKRPIGE